MNITTRKKTTRRRGFAIVAVSIALLFGIAYLKANTDSEGDSDLDN
ncbi:MAG TPA: hypothetical protein VM866_03065 [Pyrinomonadaceae bacterium]|jgi:hypothetical protein|nr:hypothetical protein [Pyrinomonadaceae bacterium]